MNSKKIIHVAPINISQESGMGRVAWHWREAFEKRGYEFIHIGTSEVGKLPHYSLFPYAAYRYFQKHIKQTPSLFLVHEPVASSFVNRGIPTIVFSHGLERRGWENTLQDKYGDNEKIKFRTRMFTPWLLSKSDFAFQKAEKLFLINSEDRDYAIKKFQTRNDDIFVFRNGINSSQLTESIQPDSTDKYKILFLGTWIGRKGIHTLVKSAQILFEKSIDIQWILAGVGKPKEIVINDWDEKIRDRVEVIPQFLNHQEQSLLANANIFVLPSFFEGQPLALLQAMEAGRCCITTNCCGQRDLIQHGYNGFLFESGDSKTLAELIEQCLKDENLRLRLGKNAKLTVQNRQWEDVSSEVVDRVEQLLQISDLKV